jgi:paraquat-inducible protein A
MSLLACHCCGLIQRVPELQARDVAMCTRCHATLCHGGDRRLAASRTAAAAVGALILFWPAVLLPILEIERLGHRHASSILLGSIELLLHGSWFVGLIVLLFSIVFPLAKILLLLELSWLSWLQGRHKAVTYRIMEHAGKWSMMDVMLLALLVMLVKLGDLVQFQLGPAVVAFVLCVMMSMVASMSFNPHSIWEHES